MNFIYLALIYLVFDIIWINLMTPILYRKVFENIQKSEMIPNLVYAVCCYCVLLVCLYFICIPLSTTYQKKYKWIAYALVGFALYSVFNLTNAAVLSEYPLKMIIIDTVWGTTVFSILGLLNTYF